MKICRLTSCILRAKCVTLEMSQGATQDQEEGDKMTKAGGLPRRPKGRAGAKRPIEGASARTTRKGYKTRRWAR